MVNKLARWRCVNMSEAARSIMVKNINNAIPVRHMISFKLPDSTISKMNSTQQAFWRNKKTNRGKHFISWRNVNKPKEEGGLGFRDLHTFNKALLEKSAWKLCTDDFSICSKSLQDKYFPDGRLLNLSKAIQPGLGD